MDQSFKGQIVVITGVTGGIGRVLAQACIERGATVIGIVKDVETVRALPELNGFSEKQLIVLTADLANRRDLENVAQSIRERVGHIDVLIHNAALFQKDVIAESKLEDFERLMSVNVFAPYSLTQSMLPLLVERKGQVVFINSSVGRQSRGGVSQYAASKHALRAIADSLREEVNHHGVRVFSIYLGRVATPMQEQVTAMEHREYEPSRLIQPIEVAETIIHSLQLPLSAEITDLFLRNGIPPK